MTHVSCGEVYVVKEYSMPWSRMLRQEWWLAAASSKIAFVWPPDLPHHAGDNRLLLQASGYEAGCRYSRHS